MKRRILAFVGAMVLAMGMSMTAFAAPSTNANDVANDPAPAATPELATGTQQFTTATIEEFAKTTTVSTSVAGAKIQAVSTEVAKAAISQAKAVAGQNAFVATIVDLNVPEGTGEASFTLGCANVHAGQNVTILHQKKDGTWESIKPSAVNNGSVTFTLSSYSPVAVVINAVSPKTGDMVMVVAGMAIVCLAGAAVFTRKARLN